jgi:type III restriction enzyme
VYRPRLTLEWERVAPLELDVSRTAQIAELVPIVEGKPDITKITEIDLERLAREFRTQRIIFETAREIYDQMQADWKGSKEYLLAHWFGSWKSSSARTKSRSRRRSSTRTTSGAG